MIKVRTKKFGDCTHATVLPVSFDDPWEHHAYSLDTLTTLHNGALRLRELALIGEVPEPEYGICFNLQQVVRRGGQVPLGSPYGFVSTCAASWPFNKGIRGFPSAYPIPEVEDNPSPWESHALRYRISLLEHMIRCAEAMIHALTSEGDSQ